MFNGVALMKTILEKYGRNVPAGLRLGPVMFFVLNDPQYAPIFFKPSPAMGANPLVVHFMRSVLGAPPRTISLYGDDNSGPFPTPFPGSNVKPENRIRSHQMRAAHSFLAGSSNGIQLSKRYTKLLRLGLSTSEIAIKDWAEYPDLYAFLRELMFAASTEALFGSELLRIVPSLNKDFWTYDHHFPTLLRLPYRWLAPRAYKARDRMLENIRKWHAHAKAHSDYDRIEPQDPDWEPYFGTKYVRARQKFFHDIDLMDANGRAADDLGLIIATSVNAIKVTFWVIFEVFTRPDLLARVRNIGRLIHESAAEESETVARGNDPLLQSIFAETARLRVTGIVGRQVLGEDLVLGKWLIPKGSFIGLDSRSASMNSDAWNIGTTIDQHPIDCFWEERFLVYPQDTESGGTSISEHPSKEELSSIDKSTSLVRKAPREPIFSTRRLNNVYVSFNGGALACPGRQFARYESINTLVEFALNFDIDFQTPPGWQPRMREGFFPTGFLPPMDMVPFRIRRREER